MSPDGDFIRAVIAEVLRGQAPTGPDMLQRVIDALGAEVRVVGLEPSLAGRTSAMSSRHPVVEVSDAMGDSRRCFTLAHELGHIILARADYPPTGARAERWCDAIAAELLLPRGWLLPHAKRIADLDGLLVEARRFRVSPATLSISLSDAGAPNSFVDARRVGTTWYPRTWTRAVAATDPFMGGRLDELPVGRSQTYCVGTSDSRIKVHAQRDGARARLWYRWMAMS